MEEEGLFERPRKAGNDGCNNKLRVAGQFVGTTVSVREVFQKFRSLDLFDDFTTRDQTHTLSLTAQPGKNRSLLLETFADNSDALEKFQRFFDHLERSKGTAVLFLLSPLNGKRGIIKHTRRKSIARTRVTFSKSKQKCCYFT